jgi:UDP-glucose 4-epimerase
MRTLVTGAAGFIGRRLMQAGHRALVRQPAGFANEMIGDLRDRGSLEAACDGMEVVFHCAGHAHALSSGRTDIHHEVNHAGVRNLLEAAGQAGVKSFVFLSSVKAMAEPGNECAGENWPGEPVTAYGLAKQAAEKAVLEAGLKYGMHVVNLRLAMVYGHGGRGNLERMANAIRSGWFPPLPDTGNRRSLVHVQDVVEAMRVVAGRKEANGQNYIVADAQPYSSREIYEAIRLALGMPASPLFTVPAGLLRTAGRLNGRLYEIVDRLIGSACYSPARIERELGWRARVCLSEGLKEMLLTSGVVK